MAWTPIVNRGLTIPQLREYVASLDFKTWKPSLIVWHNTAAPTLAQWKTSADQDRAKGLAPGQTRIINLQNYFKGRGWSSGPHAFVADDLVWAFTPFTSKGTHSPSWNGIAIGIEMIGDFAAEDDESGAGKKVRDNTIALTAMLCEKLGLDPETAIKLHKEDKKTTHDCPGKHIAEDKAEMVQEVLEYMGHGGEHVDQPEKPQWKPPRFGLVDVAKNDTLNVRLNASASAGIVAKLQPKTRVGIVDEAVNGKTRWFYVDYGAGSKGWVAARFVEEEGPK